MLHTPGRCALRPSAPTTARDSRVKVNDGGLFGPLLRHARFAACLSQEELAERAGLSVVSVSALECGRRRSPYRETIRVLCDALALSDDARRELERAAKRRGPARMADVAQSSDRGAFGRMAAHIAGTRATLPIPRTRLIGRDNDVTAVARLLREHRLVTLVGTGGIGKTRAALAVGERLIQQTLSGVCFVDFAPQARGSTICGAVVSALGLDASSNTAPIDRIVDYLRERDFILILDNCEHIVTEVAEVADTLLGRCERLHIIATSRERLRVSGEFAYRLPSLGLPPRAAGLPVRAADAARYPALALFTERAQAVDQRFILDDDNAPAVAEICRRLDGVALAIELAAARVSVLAPSALVERLDERFRILTDGERAAPPRHRTLLALIDWSYDLLSAREQRLFEGLSVFAQSCHIADTVAVCGEPGEDAIALLELLTRLVEKSLLVADGSGRDVRYAMLESTRLYAARKLAEHGRSRRAAHRLAAARAFDPMLRTERSVRVSV